MPQIEKLTHKDYDSIFELSQFAFQYKMSEKDRKKKEEEASRHEIFGYIAEGELAGKLHIIPLQMYIGNQLFDMGGISSVATWPEYRRQGVAKSLLQHALNVMKQNGQTVSLLHPFLVGFYRKYGWELAFVNKKYRIPLEKLKKDWQAEGCMKRSTDRTLLANIYEQYAQRYNGMLLRDQKWWEQRVLTDEAVQIAVGYAPSGQCESYIIYKVHENIMTVRDYAYTTRNGLHSLYEFIGNHDSMATAVELIVPENDTLVLHLADPMFEQTLEPYFMARIVDVFHFLQQYPFMGDTGSVIIEVHDDTVPANNGNYHLKINGDQSKVTHIKQGGKSDVQCSVQQLASLLLSFKRPLELHEHGLITGSETAVHYLECIIPKKQTYLADFF